MSSALVMLTSAVETEHVEDGHCLLLSSLAVISTVELQQHLLKLLVAMRHHLAHSLHQFIHPLVIAQAGVMGDGVWQVASWSQDSCSTHGGHQDNRSE